MSIEEMIRSCSDHADRCEKTGCETSARDFRQIANWLQELKERREKESRGIEIIKPYLTVQVDMDMVNRTIDKAINNLYYECPYCGAKMTPKRKKEEQDERGD